LSSGKNPCTEALLRIGLADIEYRKKDYRATEECIKSALTLAVGFDMKSPEQAIRVYRHCVSIAEAIPASQRLVDFETRRHVMRIHQLLQYTCANDQRLKFRIG
jgi:hypothetical protein